MSNSIQVYQPRPLLPTQEPATRENNHFREGLWLLHRCLLDQYSWFACALLLLVVSTFAAIFEWRPPAYLIDYLLGQRPDLLTLLELPRFASPLVANGTLLLILLVFVSLLHSLTGAWAEIVLAKCGRQLAYHLRTMLFVQLRQRTYTVRDGRQIDELFNYVADDVAALESFVATTLPASISSVLLLLLTLLALTQISPLLALVAATMLLVLTFVSTAFTQRIARTRQIQERQEDDLTAATQEMLVPVRVLQPQGHEAYTQQRFADYNRKIMTTSIQAATLQAQFTWLAKTGEVLTIAAVLGCGLWQMNQRALTAGFLMMCLILIYSLFKPLRELLQTRRTLRFAHAHLERIGALFDPNFTVPNSPTGSRPTALRGLLPAPMPREVAPLAMTRREGSFVPKAMADITRATAPSAGQPRPALQLSLKPGQVLVLRNETEVDSHLITNLLAKLAMQNGELLIGAPFMPAAAQATLLDQIDVVLREPILLNQSVADNIAYGSITATPEQMMTAAKQAQVHEFIEALPQGYATLLGEQGVQLTKVERRRLAFARAHLRDAPILLLEEPTAGLDEAAVDQLMPALQTLIQGKMVILLSHEPRIVELADKVAEFRNGRLEQRPAAQKAVAPIEEQTTQVTSDVEPSPSTKAKEDDPPTADIPSLPYELRDNPLLQQKLPTLRTALDGEAMRQHLQTELIGAARSQHYTITRCTPTKALYHHTKGCTIVYALDVQERASGKTWSPMLLAQLFPHQQAAEIYLRQTLTPLVKALSGQLPIAPFRTPVASLDALALVIQLFPVDAALPTLGKVADAQQMIDFFQKALPEGQNNRFRIDECTIEVLEYVQQEYALLYYQLDGRLANSRKPGRQVLYGKVTEKDNGERTGRVLFALRHRMQQDNSAYRFNTPQFIAHHPSLHLTLFETIPGTPQIPQLLQARLQGKPQSAAGSASNQPGLLTLEKALDASARMAATLHTSPIALGEPRALETELAELQTQIQLVRQFSLTFAKRLQQTLTAIQAFADTTAVLPLCFSHGAFTLTQPRFDRIASGLFDFDAVCQAEPALDLGEFQAALRVAIDRAQPKDPATLATATALADKLCIQFLHTYLIELGYAGPQAEQFYLRVCLYELISLLRTVLRTWQELQTDTLSARLALLEARLAALPAVSTQTTPQPAPSQRQPSFSSHRRSSW